MQPNHAVPTQTEVHIRVETDADATRITTLLEALGYRVVRRLDDADTRTRLGWAIERMSRVHRLTSREREVLAGVLEGDNNERLATRLGLSRATVKWHLHNVFTKSNVANREALLRSALELGSNADPHWAGPADVTIEIE
jgi:ATP/maltotriose-dependent transcriptional regulator MalT